MSTCAGWPNGKKLASKFELDQSQRKSTQVGGQTKRKSNASRKLASTCESVWPGLKVSILICSLQVNMHVAGKQMLSIAVLQTVCNDFI